MRVADLKSRRSGLRKFQFKRTTYFMFVATLYASSNPLDAFFRGFHWYLRINMQMHTHTNKYIIYKADIEYN